MKRLAALAIVLSTALTAVVHGQFETATVLGTVRDASSAVVPDATVTLTNTATGAVFAGSASTTKTGWTIGGGWEYRFSPQWSVFIEGNYYDFGSRDRTIVDPVCAGGACVFSTKATAATALVGVNYRFGGFGG